MVSDSELAEKVQDLLQGSDLKKTTNNIVIKQLESQLGLDLSAKKAFLRDQVTRFLQTQFEDCEEEEQDDGVIDREDAGDDVVDVSDSDDDEVGGAVRASNGGGTTLKSIKVKLSKSGGLKKERRECLSGKFCTLSPELQQFLGVPHMTRTEVVKHLWNYVREKNLKDPQDGKSIICDETLRGLLGVDSINILQINKALTKHIQPQVKRLRKAKKDILQKHKIDEVPCVDGIQEKRQKKVVYAGFLAHPSVHEAQEKRPKRVVYSGFLAPSPISESLTKFLGTGENALTRADAVKRIWEYIKDKQLQDPSDKKTVLCDEKLKELFNVDSFHGFTVSKLLCAHFVKL